MWCMLEVVNNIEWTIFSSLTHLAGKPLMWCVLKVVSNID